MVESFENLDNILRERANDEAQKSLATLLPGTRFVVLMTR